MLDGFRAVAARDFLHVQREQGARFVIPIPILQPLLLGLAIRVEVTGIPTALVAFDGTHESRVLIAPYVHARACEVERRLASLRALGADPVADRTRAGVLVPPGSGR